MLAKRLFPDFPSVRAVNSRAPSAPDYIPSIVRTPFLNRSSLVSLRSFS